MYYQLLIRYAVGQLDKIRFSSMIAKIRPIQIPDVIPRFMIPQNIEFSMSAGDFIESYSSQCGMQLVLYLIINEITEEWDCVCTCFFIDTAKNIVEYIEIISNILKPGGVWINLGVLAFKSQHC